MSPLNGFRRFHRASRQVHFGSALIVGGVGYGVFRYLDRHTGPLGPHDAVVILGLLLFTLCVAFPDRLAKLGAFFSKTKLGNTP